MSGVSKLNFIRMHKFLTYFPIDNVLNSWSQVEMWTLDLTVFNGKHIILPRIPAVLEIWSDSAER